jgi:hypothetical protein
VQGATGAQSTLAGPQGAQGAQGAPGYAFGTFRASSTPTTITTGTQVGSAYSQFGAAFVTGSIQVTSTRSGGTGQWVGTAECTWSGAGVTGSGGTASILFDGDTALIPGSQLFVLANVGQGSTGVVSCTVNSSSGGVAPTVQVTVNGFMGLSVNDTAAGYVQFN